VLSVFNGATFTSTTTSPLISLSSATLTHVPPSGILPPGALLNVQGVGGPSGVAQATVTLSGPLLSVTGSTLNYQGRLLLSREGGRIIETHPTSPFVSISGGSHSISSSSGFNGMFALLGRAGAALVTQSDTDPLITALGSLTIGTDVPLSRTGSGALFELSNAATVTTQQALLNVDSAVLSATWPILSVKGGSTFTSATDAISLNSNAKITAVGPVFRIDGSTVNLTNGSAFRVGCCPSGFSVSGDLLSIINGGKLNITNGAILKVDGGSLVNISGAIVNFGGTGGNQINITNTNGQNLCAVSCLAVGGINILATNGATITNVGGPGSAIKNGGLGSVNTAINVPAIIADGAGTKVNFQGN
jgi:hypothetical protein